MEIVFSHENDKLNAVISGRIDSTNAEELGKQIFQALDETGTQIVVMDMSRLEYISSAGLRVLFKTQKRTGEMYLNQVSSSVYNVLKMTGFISIFHVTQAARRISLEGCEQLSSGGNGKVFRLGKDEIIKVFTTNMSREEIQRTLDRAKAAFLAGVPTPISYDVVDADDEGVIKPGVIYEMMADSTLATAIDQHPDQFEEYMQKYVSLVESMHDCVVDSSDMEDVKKMYRERMGILKQYLTADEMSLLYALLDRIPDRNTFVHNDPHANNIMISGDELMFVDMDDCGKGHPIFDLASLHQDLISSASMEKRVPGCYMRVMGFPVETGARVWKRFVQLYFKTDDDIVRQIEQLTAPYEAIRSMTIVAMKYAQTDMLPQALSKYREELFPALPKLISMPFVWPK